MAASSPILPLRMCSYNAQGLATGASWGYMNDLMKTNDLIFVQETWLRKSQDHLFTDNIRNADFTSVSAMDDAELTISNPGRPHGGCAILWNSSLCCGMVPVHCDTSRVCALKCTLPNSLTCLLCCTYMPCDMMYNRSNYDEYCAVLSELERLIIELNADYIVCAGDFNTDFSRTASLHTNALSSFIHDVSLCSLHDLPMYEYNVPFTYESKANGARSILDHFFVSQNLYSLMKDVYVSFSVENSSDHYPLHVYFDIDIGPKAPPRSRPPKQLWAKATDACLSQYANDLVASLSQIDAPMNVIECRDPCCDNPEHRDCLQSYHDAIVDCCIDAGSCIPLSSSPTRCIPGWNLFVRPLLEKALFWHSLWISNGRPQLGVVAEVRRYTRARYHKAIKHVKAMESAQRAARLADRFYEGRSQEFWNEVSKIKGRPTDLPASVGDAVGDEAVAELFSDCYSTLYKSVGFDSDKLRDTMDEVAMNVLTHDNRCSAHTISSNDVERAVHKLKRNKHDGHRGLYSDHLKNAPRSLLLHLGYLLNSCLVHGFSPGAFGVSILIPIPKSKFKSKNDPSNYRSIALSSILNKVLDKILIVKCKAGLSTSPYQFGFKQLHSTAQCSFVVGEVVQHYVNAGNAVYGCLLDASKAFDRIAYCKLFEILCCRNVCPIVIRFLHALYLNQTAAVQWGSARSEPFAIENGVKQGGVLSPVLFTVYLDELLTRLSRSRIGCHIGSIFAGAFAYADDVILLSPSLGGLIQMLNICESYAAEFQVVFNSSKSKLVVINGSPLATPVPFMGGFIEQVRCERHLGLRFGNFSKEEMVDDLCKQMITKSNMLRVHFKNVPPDVMYSLFKTYCMPLYGAPLLDFDDRSIEKLFTTWRKCVRSVLSLPPRTHSKYLPLICEDLSINQQLYSRFAKFFFNLHASSNPIVSLCAKLALRGSGSNVSNNLCVMSQMYSVNRTHLPIMQTVRNDIPGNDNDLMLSNIIQELIDNRWKIMNDPHTNSFLTLDEINILLFSICTD